MSESMYLSVQPKAVMCDMDGCLATVHGRSPYDGDACETDLPNWPVIECVRAMDAAGVAVIFVSGRQDSSRRPTEQWISRYARRLPSLEEIPHALLMRLTGDNRPDDIVKRELYERHVAGKYDVLFVLDDRRRVVRMWRDVLGLTCFQVNDGPKNEKDECVHCGGLGVSRALQGDEKEAAVALAELCSRPSWEPMLSGSERVIKSIVKAVSKGRAR